MNTMYCLKCLYKYGNFSRETNVDFKKESTVH
jgi:hypothetical protein